jgi:hypothetical protein
MSVPELPQAKIKLSQAIITGKLTGRGLHSDGRSPPGLPEAPLGQLVAKRLAARIYDKRWECWKVNKIRG